MVPAAEFGLETAPCKAFAVCDEIQGFAVTPDGTAVLSRSAGLKDSKLLQYRCGGDPDGSFHRAGSLPHPFARPQAERTDAVCHT